MDIAKESEFELLGTGGSCVCVRDTGVRGMRGDDASYSDVEKPSAGTEPESTSHLKKGPFC